MTGQGKQVASRWADADLHGAYPLSTRIRVGPDPVTPRPNNEEMCL